MARELCEDKSRDMGSSGGFCYSEVSPNNHSIQTQFTQNQIQTEFHEPNNSEMFNLTTGMEIIGFSKNSTENHPHETASSSGVLWKEFNKSDHHHHHHHHFGTGISEAASSGHDQNLMVGPDQSGPWGGAQENRFLVDDSSLRCVFSCEGNERPSQGLTLTLSSANPSSLGLRTFELRHTGHHQPVIQDGFFAKSPNPPPHHHHQATAVAAASGQFHIRNSTYLSPAQELLNEFCSLGTKQTDSQKQKSAAQKNKQWEDHENGDNNGASSSKKQALYSLDFMELQKRKTKLLSMLEEVERRYKNYCDQMKAVVSSFEAVAGAGAATVYSALASKAMSRHFRCLKDGIVSQIQATRKAMGEKDVAAPGTSRGETPRLRVLDQALRQQRAFQQMSMIESHPWRPQRGLPERSVSVLRAWLFEHFLHPYPSDVDKHILARQTGLSRSQVSNWFINARVRLWKPMVEEMYLDETKEQLDANNNNNNNIGSSSDGVTMDLGDPSRPARPDHDQKPTPDQLVRIDSECLSSIVINPDKTDLRSSKALQPHPGSMQVQRQQNFGRFPESAFGTMELDFSSYNQHQTSSAMSAGTVLYPNDGANLAFNGGGSGGGGGVSLTLGLQQHAGGNHGVSLAFSPASQSSLFYPRDHEIDDQCQPGVQYSLLDGEGQNLPYRNLMGAQLLHDLA